jgi:hypothetical protein
VLLLLPPLMLLLLLPFLLLLLLRLMTTITIPHNTPCLSHPLRLRPLHPLLYPLGYKMLMNPTLRVKPHEVMRVCWTLLRCTS